mgnify:CR=1 FL=1
MDNCTFIEYKWTKISQTFHLSMVQPFPKKKNTGVDFPVILSPNVNTHLTGNVFWEAFSYCYRKKNSLTHSLITLVNKENIIWRLEQFGC